jgi:flagellin-like protein
LRKLLRSKKALSPVVAAIILIAVTVAVSIAVAAWMGALTIGFMGGTEELKILDIKFNAATYIVNVEVANVGTGKVTIKDVKLDGTLIDATKITYIDPFTTDGVLDKGLTGTIKIAYDVESWPFKSGTKYVFALVTASGNQFLYTATAPS